MPRMAGPARHVLATGHDRFCWFVRKDDEKAQGFYRGLGATPDPDWDRWILPPAAVSRLAGPEQGG